MINNNKDNQSGQEGVNKVDPNKRVPTPSVRDSTSNFFAEAFNIDQETGKMLKCKSDQRGYIVMVERGLGFVSPIVIRKQQG
ncbi:11S globulin seed storage protein G3-like protein [Tanacetum coccineum]